MTDQERQLIEGLIARIQNAPAPQVDRDADDLIRRGLASRPDALYILTQTVLIQEMALKQAKEQSNTSFLGNTQQGGYQGSNYAQQPQYDPPPPPPPSGGRFSGFLHNAAQTAAGVVAGEVAFSALSSIFGGHGGGYGGGSGFFGGGSGIYPGSETIVNNYYEGQGQGGSSEHGFGSGNDGGLSPDLEDRRFASDSSDIMPDDSTDDSSYDDNSSDSSDV